MGNVSSRPPVVRTLSGGSSGRPSEPRREQAWGWQEPGRDETLLCILMGLEEHSPGVLGDMPVHVLVGEGREAGRFLERQTRATPAGAGSGAGAPAPGARTGAHPARLPSATSAAVFSSVSASPTPPRPPALSCLPTSLSLHLPPRLPERPCCRPLVPGHVATL